MPESSHSLKTTHSRPRSSSRIPHYPKTLLVMGTAWALSACGVAPSSYVQPQTPADNVSPPDSPGRFATPPPATSTPDPEPVQSAGVAQPVFTEE